MTQYLSSTCGREEGRPWERDWVESSSVPRLGVAQSDVG